MIIIEKLAKLMQCTHFELQNATNYIYLICPDPKLLILVCHCFLLQVQQAVSLDGIFNGYHKIYFC